MEPNLTITQLITDTLMLIAVGVPPVIIKQVGTIRTRGFFCNDETLLFPKLSKSDLGKAAFQVASCLANIIAIMLIEYFHLRRTGQKVQFFKFKLPRWFYNVYSILVTFAFGILCTILMTIVLKGCMGRQRPYFLTTCAPNISCSEPENQHVYHTNYECTKKPPGNIRLSFPSGHASFAMYCTVFLTLYLQKRMNWPLLKLVKQGIQVVSFVLVLNVAAHRIANYKHHWSDVAGGFLIGGGCAILVSINLYWVSDPLGLKQEKGDKSDPEAG